jgi:hypothetical protein
MASQGVEVVAVPDAAHYPHAQRPDLTVPGTLAFLSSLRNATGSWGARA